MRASSTFAASGTSSRRGRAPDSRATTAFDSATRSGASTRTCRIRRTVNLNFNLTANESRTNYQNPVHTTTNDAVRFDAQWSWGTWQTSAYASWRRFVDTEQPTETVAEAGFRIRRTWTKLDLNFVAAIQQRTKGEIVSPNGIIHFVVVRRF